MISTGIELTDFTTALNADATIPEDLLSVLLSTAKATIEEERPWVVLWKTDSSKSVTTSNTWQTAIDLSTITDFSRFNGETPIRLFDGDKRIEYFRRIPTDRRLEYKDAHGTFVFDDSTKMLYLNGTLPFSGTLWINYIATSEEIDPTSDSAVWTPFPARFLPLLGYYAVGINKGAVDYDSINRQMLPENRATFDALKSAMEKWDDERQLSMLEHNDPTDGYGGFRERALNTDL